jgi:hypothetical protein
MSFLNDLSRPHYAGTAADVSIHIEEHLGIVDKAFAYTSKFAPLMNIRTLRGTNVARLDRIGNVKVGGRKSGEELIASRVVNDKWNLTVDTLLYLRHQFDNQDEWVSDLAMRKEIAELDGIELAKMFDQACLIAVAKAAALPAPTGLEDAFSPGILETLDLTSLTTPADKAEALVRIHRKICEKFVDRDLGDDLYSEGLTPVSAQVFSLLLEHGKLMNVEFQGGPGNGENDFARARVAIMNGVRVLETPRFARAAIAAHPLGTAFNVSAAEAKRQMLVFIPSKTLITAQVQPVTAKFWEWEEKFSWVLDTFQMYNIGARRPDTAAAVEITGL